MIPHCPTFSTMDTQDGTKRDKVSGNKVHICPHQGGLKDTTTNINNS